MRVFITGAAGGIGRAIAEKFLGEGHRVFGFDLRESSLENPAYRHYCRDICAEEGPSPEETPEILISCAGTIEEEKAIDVNLRGTIRFAQRYAESPGLRSILFIASASARNGAEFPRYVASKAGLVGYMKNLALALSKRGVTVNSVSPGGVVTPANDHILNDPALYRAVKAETLLGKWAASEEVADLIYYMTAVNRSITGEDILMDNGEQLKSNFIW